jgi:acyl CoA:acetate/3-ketoacid CoA transferase alpha subunit/acyl CoA:acetate/3-ketoacid CoA transferase beta subunit
MSLAEAVRQFVRPRMSLHFGGAWAFPNAALFEIIRQFARRDPGFTLILSVGGAASAGPFLAAGLARRAIAAFLADGYPVPGPNPAIQRAINSGQVTAENWTILTLAQRLLAGALNLPYMPTRSILGSSLENDLGDQFRRAPNPFNPTETVGLVPALHPDLNLTHGWAADPDGNTLLPPPLSGNAFGALAARAGTIVTVEKIVSPEVLRAHSYMTRIPAHAVRVVCEAPFGAHPLGCLGLGLPDGEGYAEDRAFMLAARAAARSEETQNRWIRDWIFDCRDHAAYLARLGSERLAALAVRSQPRRDSGVTPGGTFVPDYEQTDAEKMISAAAREIVRAVRERGHRTILCGLGAAHLAAWLAEAQLRDKGIAVTLLTEVGAVGFQPLPGDPFLFALRNVPTAPMTTDTLTVMGMFVGSERVRCLGVLGAAQLDRHGNINTTRMPDGSYLMGSGGANDVASTAAEIIAVARQSRARFVEHVNYVTSPGARVSTVVTQLGVYQKVDDELVLTGGFAEDGARAAREACGWDLHVAENVELLPLPTADERKLIRAFDPVGDLWG